MRDKLIHAYHGVDLRVVWRTIREDLPVVVAEMRRLLKELDDAGAHLAGADAASPPESVDK